jgi:hypothetical protein
MTRAELVRHVQRLDTAAQSKGLCARSELGNPASDEDFSKCESSLAIQLPDSYKASLREWNGASIELYDPDSGEPGYEVLHAQFRILDTKWIASTTRVLREIMTEAMEGSAVAIAVKDAMSRVAVIASQDDLNVLITCVPKTPPDLTVRCLDLAYALSERPPTAQVIAASPDQYFEKCFAHLTTTLERETYWL